MEAETGTVLSIMAHPDDAEFLCAGVLALLAARGWAVHIASSTPGDCGSASLGPEAIAAVRREEASAAAALLGGSYHCLELSDLLVTYGEGPLRRFIALLRRVRPRIVITHSPHDYMLDHEETSRLARAACFAAPVPNAPVTEGASEPPLSSIPVLYYADPVGGVDILGRRIVPQFAVDIGTTLEAKLGMLARHASQRDWLRRHHGEDEYMDSARRWARECGEAFGLDYAEGFRQHLGHAFPEWNALRDLLGQLVVESSGRAGA